MRGGIFVVLLFFFKQKTEYEMRISDWSSDVCSSDLCIVAPRGGLAGGARRDAESGAEQTAEMRLVAEAALVGDVGNALAGIQWIAERQQALAQAALAHVMLHAAEALELTVELATRDEQLADDGIGRQRLAMQVLFDVVPDPARQVDRKST